MSRQILTGHLMAMLSFNRPAHPMVKQQASPYDTSPDVNKQAISRVREAVR